MEELNLLNYIGREDELEHICSAYKIHKIIHCPDAAEYRKVVVVYSNGDTGNYNIYGCPPLVHGSYFKIKPKTYTQWVNIYTFNIVSFNTKELADRNADSDRIACIEITYTEGQGL